jgi:transposase InsO family protein
MISPATLAQILRERDQAAYGTKSAVVRAWAKTLNVAYATIYNQLSAMTPPKQRKHRSDKDKIPAQYVEWTKTIWMVKSRPPKENGVIATDQALQHALTAGLIPPDAARIPVSTYNRYARILHLNRTGGRHARFQAKYANLVHQIDASSSAFFYIARIDDGEPVLKLHRKAAAGNYKNKPVPTRQRPIIYGLVDDYSGALCARYYSAEGESAADGLDFLQHAWAGSTGMAITPAGAPRLRGLPKLLYLDNGPLKAGPVNEFLIRLDIKKINSRPYEARGKGKIERPWRTMWSRFELTFFMVDNWQEIEITLTELNRQFENYLIEYNNRPHRYQKDLSRINAWWQSVTERGGVIDIPAKALSTVFRRDRRVVNGGYFSYLNQEYEVKGLDEGVVWVYEGIFNDRLIVEDVKTHRKYNVTLFEPLAFGQKIELVQSEAEKIAEAGREKISITETFYDQSPESDSKVARLPIRSREKELEDPLEIMPDMPDAEEELLFDSPRERYEWQLKKQIAGESLPENEVEFMRKFEKTDLYRQLSATYERWIAFGEKRAAMMGGNR